MKMLVFDLDGTLLSKDRRVSDTTATYLQELKNKGVKIVVATGRVRKSAEYVCKGGEFVDVFICDTGSLIYDNNAKRELRSEHLTKNFASIILDLYNKDKIHYIDICDHEYIHKLTHTPEDYFCIKNYQDKEVLLNNIGDILHIGIDFYDDKDAIKLVEKLSRENDDVNPILMQDSFGEHKWVEIMPKNVNKPTSIEWLEKYFNIDNQDVMAFGDGLNDVDMLKYVGVGVAMKNALAEVKSVAKLVTDKPNTEDGIVDFLKKYLN